jgi:hypothetical protein
MKHSAFLALAMLAACTTPQEPTPQSAPGPDTCGIAQFNRLIGSDAAAIDRATLPPRTRIIAPDQPVTMDYSAERLNIMTDAAGRVTELRCF